MPRLARKDMQFALDSQFCNGPVFHQVVVRPSSDQQRNRVVYQSPAPNAGVNRDANITLKFGS